MLALGPLDVWCGWGVVYVFVPCWALSEVFHVDDRYRPVGGSSGP